jgi:hypothetical protein
LTASVLIGNATSASLAANSLLLQGTGSNGFATTASLTAVSSSGQQVSASYIALSGSYNVFSGSASTRITNTSQSLQAVSSSTQQVSASYIALSASYNTSSGSTSTTVTALSSSNQQLSASYIALSASYNTFSGSASTRITANSSSIQSVSASTQQVSASYIALSASYNVFSGSASARITAVSSSDQQTSASYIALSGSYNVFSGSASTRITNTEVTASNLVAASASFSTRVSDNTSNIQTLTSATASYAVLANNQTFTGKNTFNNDVTASNVRITGTASIAFLDVQFQSSSVIYSSGSNQFGDASNDTQTLWGTVNVVTGPLVVTGSVNVSGSITVFDANNSVITHHLKAPSSNGVEILNNGGNVVALFGAGGSQGTTFNGQVNATAFSGSGALVYGVVSSSFANNAENAVTASLASFAVIASAAVTASFATNAATASVLLGAVVSSSYAFTASSAEKAFEAVSSSYALTASFALNGGGGAAFPFTGSAVITGSLVVTGSATISTGSLILYSYKNATASNRPFEAMVTQSEGSTNNIISIVNTLATGTGSMVISGSGNYISLSALPQNSSFTNGATSGFSGTNAYITQLPITSGSNPNYNTATDRNNRRVPTITNANVNAVITVNDNRASETGVPFSTTNSSINSTITVNTASGSISLNNSTINGSGLTLVNSGSGTLNANASIASTTICGASTNIILAATGSGQASISNSLIIGQSNRVIITGSSAGGGTTTASPTMTDSIIAGNNLIVTGSNITSVPIAVVGSFNTADGILNDARFTRFAIGTGTTEGTRLTSFHVSASGLTSVNSNLQVSYSPGGSNLIETRQTYLKLGYASTLRINATGSVAITGSLQMTGSLVGQPVSQSVSSLTASLNLAAGNFFNLTLPASANTYITASGQLPGQTVNIKVTQGSVTGSLSFGAGFKQVSGSAYTGSSTANAVDIVTLISFDTTGLYVSNVNNLI